jgi:hypothetical protein
MKPVRESKAGLITLAIGGGLALNYPLLSLFDHAVSVFGIPLPFVYLFVVWALLIAGMAVLIERHGSKDTAKDVKVGGSSGVSERQSQAFD